MASRERPPAYYGIHGGGWRDWWIVLHPPYTAWHLSYVVIGAMLAPTVHGGRLIATLIAFFAAVGVAAHALDELHGRPLRTEIPSATLAAAAIIGLTVAVGIGIVGVVEVGWVLLPFVVVGPLLALVYNLELFGGVVHTDLGFALAWGAFPVVTAYVAQTDSINAAALIAALGATASVAGATVVEHSGEIAPSAHHAGRRHARPRRRQRHRAVARVAPRSHRAGTAGDLVGGYRAGRGARGGPVHLR